MTQMIKNFFSLINSQAGKVITLLYQTLFTIISLTGLFYIRLLPHISHQLWTQMNQYAIFATCVKIGFVVANIFIILGFMEILKPKTTHPMIEKIKLKMTKVSEYILKQLIGFYNLIWFIAEEVAYKIFGYEILHYMVMRKFAQCLIKTKHPHALFRFLLSLNLLPRILFTFAFVYDVLITQYLHYTFYCIPFLLLPLLEKFILFVLQHFYAFYWEGTSFLVQVKESDTSIDYSFIPEFQNTVPPGPPHVKDFSDYYENHYFVLEELNKALTAYQEWKFVTCNYYTILLILSVVRLFLLLFILFYGIL